MSHFEKPLMAELELTSNCNLICQHCYNFFAYPKRKKESYVSLEKIESIVKKISDTGVFHLLLTGGEPFLNLELLYSAINSARNNFLDVTINTNATLINDEIASELFKLKIKGVLVSICGSTDLKHDKITNTKGSFNKTINGIKALINSGIQVSVNIVAQKESISDIFATAELLSKIGVRSFCATPITPCLATKSHVEKMLTPNEIITVWDQLIKAEQQLGIFTRSLRPIPHCAFESLDSKYYKFLLMNCTAGKTVYCSDCIGQIRACTHSDKIYGNILSESFDSIWDSMSEWRDNSFISDKCKTNCIEYTDCGAGCRATARTINGSLSDLDPYMTKALSKAIDFYGQNVIDYSKNNIINPESIIALPQYLRHRKDGKNHIVCYDIDGICILEKESMDTFLLIANEIKNQPKSIKSIANKYSFNELNLTELVRGYYNHSILKLDNCKCLQ